MDMRYIHDIFDIFSKNKCKVLCLGIWLDFICIISLSDFLLQPFRKPKRVRTAFSPTQLLKLEHAFESNHYVVGAERKQLAQGLSLTETQVSPYDNIVWLNFSAGWYRFNVVTKYRCIRMDYAGSMLAQQGLDNLIVFFNDGS